MFQLYFSIIFWMQLIHNDSHRKVGEVVTDGLTHLLSMNEALLQC